jgi:hypothetical protein
MSVKFNEVSNQLTYSPIEPGQFLTPEFLDVQGVRVYFGLKQSFLYRLLAENKIRAVCIRQRGKVRGRRLFDVASIRSFLNSQVDKQGNAGRPKKFNPQPPEPAAAE